MIVNKVIRILTIIVTVWLIGCIISFLSGIFILYLGAPSWLPLPWSDFYDFIQIPDGKVFVDIRFYNRVLCYNENGEFVASYPYPPGRYPRATGLAVNEDGHILFLSQDILYIYNSSWEVLEKIEGEKSGRGRWQMGGDGKPIYLKSNVENPSVPDRVVKPGEYIFRNKQRSIFRCIDGSQLVREWNCLNQYSEEGELVGQYSGPKLLSIFTLPWPAFLAFRLGFLFAYIEKKKRGLKKNSPPT